MNRAKLVELLSKSFNTNAGFEDYYPFYVDRKYRYKCFFVYADEITIRMELNELLRFIYTYRIVAYTNRGRSRWTVERITFTTKGCYDLVTDIVNNRTNYGFEDESK